MLPHTASVQALKEDWVLLPLLLTPTSGRRTLQTVKACWFLAWSWIQHQRHKIQALSVEIRLTLADPDCSRTIHLVKWQPLAMEYVCEDKHHSVIQPRHLLALDFKTERFVM